MADNETDHINRTTSLTLAKNGYWLWDDNRKMNLAMRSPTREHALIEALEYYQQRCIDLESRLKKFEDHFTELLEKSLELNEDVNLVYVPKGDDY